ncbi:leucyl/phenylalanyl-tRNA--protein transferase [Congregibacter litoralis]|uniref:Leucyl/phenylalanyl-tRNA--protein transferase n=1 Tax=Congregibacter litoralis KT71 TaxID=314285 RepID=A4A3B3_9GAMM|nr:leucyl/phenylalanyl-tRNA--protein transferase [Congregibacter litoralis]EAQ99186.1 leucyl/phenylalanyl-tRNA--protein transferase [Congregibacter litoralis KT71]
MPLLHYLEPGEDFPPSSEALAYPSGLLAAGGRLDSATLLKAYGRGIFPWYEAPQPVLWWTPDPRSILPLEDLHVSRSLRKTLRRDALTLSIDKAFADVMEACAAPRDGQRGTWIDRDMIQAYHRLSEEGHAHSIEVWREGTLVGGLYGVAIGGAFFGESMFSRETDASKIALVALVWVLRKRGAVFIDCQIESEHLNSLGARNVSRVDFENRLQHTVDMSPATDNWVLPESTGALL